MHHKLNSLISWFDKYLIAYLFLWLKYSSDYTEHRRKPLRFWFYNFSFRLKKIAESLVLFFSHAYLRHLNNPCFMISLSMKF
jgi:hypothetical protein